MNIGDLHAYLTRKEAWERAYERAEGEVEGECFARSGTCDYCLAVQRRAEEIMEEREERGTDD